MGRTGLAFKLFFKTLFNRDFAHSIAAFLTVKPEPARPAAFEKPLTPPAARSEAITLLALLQREARLVDFLMEPIDAYGDAQIGAAVRDVHRDAGSTLRRCFALAPVMDHAEGADVQLATPIDANRTRLTGNVGANTPSRGKLMHKGWQATKVELPQYSGDAGTAKIIAPAEIEV